MGITVLIITCAINILLITSLLISDPRSGSIRAFVLMSIFICVWVVSNYITGDASFGLMANNIANRIAFISGYGVVSSELIFTNFFPVRRPVNRLEAFLVSIISVGVIALSATSLVAGDVTMGVSGELEFSTGPLIWLYLLIFLLNIVLIVRNSVSVYIKFKNDKKIKTQISIVLIAFCISVIAGLLLNAIIPALINNWSITTQFGPLVTVIFVGAVVYAIIQYRMFDIKFAVIRTITYVLFLGFITGIYFLLAYTVSRSFFGESSDTFSRGLADMALVVFAALLFQPIKSFLNRVTNKIFFKDGYSSSEFFARLNRIITLTTDLRSLLVGSANEIAETLKIEQVSFVAVKQNDRIITAGTDKYSRIPKEDVDKIDEYIVSRGSATLVKSLLNEDKVEHEMARLMTSHKLEIIVPLLLSDKRIGYLCLGDKKISKFNRRDVGIMEAVADELTIAIQNALAVQEIREFNETLQQRIANATRELRKNNTMLRKLDKAKDEFVGMASHQLRTPLTSIKGYISMVLEGDAGKISEQQKHLLNEAFISSERMVHLIGDFLNVSRIQTGRFTIERTPVDLSKVVQQEVETLQSSAKARNLEYKYERPKDFPTLDLDESKLRQVIMNFADNALYYSRENSVIDVELRVDGSDIVYTVKDTGIGVPKEEQDDLFTKFFRASNARIQRPDGTGVGLYLAKRIITGHGGKVIFKSVEGKGSTFGFRLPIE